MWSRFPAFLLAVAVLTALSGCGSDEPSPGRGRGDVPYPDVPSGQGGDNITSNKNLASLQSRASSGVVNPPPWADYWWPYSADGIAFAAQKYEQAGGGSGAVSWEVSNHGRGLGNVADWWGHCNGWAAAAMLTPQPTGSRTVGSVTFSAIERRALLTEIFMEVTGDFLGNRVNDASDTSSAAFQDIVPAQFHLMVTNVIGLQRRAFVMDRYTGYQVWNHPVVAYRLAPITPDDYLGPDPQFPNVHRVNVAAEVWWVADDVEPGVETPPFDFGAPASVFQSRILRYELWLDGPPQFSGTELQSSGNIILTEQNGQTVGGQWKNASLPLVNSHPDYMWIPTGPAASTGYRNPRVDDAWVLSNLR